MKVKYHLLFIIFSLLFISCFEEESDDDQQEVTNIPDEELVVTFRYMSPSTGELGEAYSFTDASWTNNQISFSNGNDPAANWIRINEANINGNGQYPILYAPYAEVSTNHPNPIYASTVVPDFWIPPSNNGTLIQGGDFNNRLDYFDVFEHIVQGGMFNITSYNSRYISGDLFFVGWVFSDTLNREVAFGVYIEFSGVEHSSFQ
jgi:hypothetical protein